jgi:hypothetical protein
MGDRHWLAVHTKRTLMSEQCSDDVRDRWRAGELQAGEADDRLIQ